MKRKIIQHIDINKYRPVPIDDIIMSEDYDSLENKALNIVFNDLTEYERNLLIASVEFGSQTKLAQELNVSSATISITLKKIKDKIKNKLKKCT